jgi:pimeloyl-ACP methyl ester carboxylesterase
MDIDANGQGVVTQQRLYQLIRQRGPVSAGKGEDMNTVTTQLLDIGYEGGGPQDGPAVLLLHGWPDDVRGWRGVVPHLEHAGFRWVAPWSRGFGPTRFLSVDTIRDGSAVALAQDAIDLADHLGWTKFSVVGHDCGARTAYTLAALFPERLSTIIALALSYSPCGEFPTPAFEQSRRWWYQWFMTTDRGAEAVRADPKGFARQQWNTWSPPRWFDDVEFEATAKSFENRHWMNITLNAYRSRWKTEPADDRYVPLKGRLRSVETLSTPTLMIQGGADKCNPPSESDSQDGYFTGGYRHAMLDGVGHFPAREAPNAVASYVLSHLKAFA